MADRNQYIVNQPDISKALLELGGLAPVREIQDHILRYRLRGKVPANYDTERTFRQTIQRKIEDFCPEAAGFGAKGNQAKFTRVSPGVYASAETNYWIELYWPDKRKRRRQQRYYMWINSRKLARHQKIRAGDVVFFYETQWKGQDRSQVGSMTLFAAGVVSDARFPVDKQYREEGIKDWIEWREVEIIAWVQPEKGISRLQVNRAIGKGPKFILRSGPFRVPNRAAAIKLLESLRELDSSSRHARRALKKNEFRNLSLKSEVETRRTLAKREGRIVKRHNALTNNFRRFCMRTLGVLPKEDRFDLLIEYRQRRLLIEAKSEYRGGLGRAEVRTAIGQLFDYRFKFWPRESARTDLAILLPGKPESDVCELLWDVLGIHVFWAEGGEFAGLPDAEALLRKIASAVAA